MLNRYARLTGGVLIFSIPAIWMSVIQNISFIGSLKVAMIQRMTLSSYGLTEVTSTFHASNEDVL